MKRVEFHPAADEEFLSAVAFYETRSPGLGGNFIQALSRTIDNVVEFPESGRRFGSRLRRVLVGGFPFALLYKAELDRIFVVAVSHLNRRPGYWRSRL